MEFVQPFLTDALVAMVMFACGWIGRVAYQWYQTVRPARRVWQLKDGDAVLIVTPNPSGYVGDEFSDTVFPTDYTAVAGLRHFLTRVYPKLDVSEYFAQEFPSAKIGEHVVLIGGEDINPLMETVLKRLRPAKFPLEFDDDHIVDHEDGGRVYRPDILFDPSTHRNEIIKDYALVTGVPNPFEPTKRMYIMAGCYVHGNMAAAQSMTEPAIRKVADRSGGESKFAYLVRCQVLRRYVGNIEIVRFYVYDETHQRWTLKE